MDEEKKALEKVQEKTEKAQQDLILGRKKARPKLTFGLKNKQPS